jgi:methionyl-tRNA formyltransferase
MTYNFFCDVPDSFMHEYLPSFIDKLKQRNINAKLFDSVKEMPEGDIAFFISCGTILSNEQIKRHKTSIVAHPSKLPLGRGSGAVSWAILEGSSDIWVTLFEVTEKIDRGAIFKQGNVALNGGELCIEIRSKQAQLTFDLIESFIHDYPNVIKTEQVGQSTFLRKRKPKDSMLDITKSIDEQFNLLRICDNTRYPAFFIKNGEYFFLHIYKDSEAALILKQTNL